MGQVYDAIDTNTVIQDFEIRNFVETGTGIGDTVSSILSLGIDNLNVYSIEVFDELYESNVKKFTGHSNLHLRHGYTHAELPIILNEIEGPTLFFLDAHFPGADFGYTSYFDEKDKSINTPLESELRCIARLRDVSRDFFVIDDLRCYEDCPPPVQNWPERVKLGLGGIGFVYELFAETHYVYKVYLHQGFIVLAPKSSFSEGDADVLISQPFELC